MTDRIALILFLLIAAAVAADLALQTGATLFLLRKLAGFVEYLAFWR